MRRAHVLRSHSGLVARARVPRRPASLRPLPPDGRCLQPHSTRERRGRTRGDVMGEDGPSAREGPGAGVKSRATSLSRASAQWPAPTICSPSNPKENGPAHIGQRNVGVKPSDTYIAVCTCNTEHPTDLGFIQVVLGRHNFAADFGLCCGKVCKWHDEVMSKHQIVACSH